MQYQKICLAIFVMAAKYYEKEVINHGDERYVYEIYGKAMANLLKEGEKRVSLVQRKKK